MERNSYSRQEMGRNLLIKRERNKLERERESENREKGKARFERENRERGKARIGRGEKPDMRSRGLERI